MNSGIENNENPNQTLTIKKNSAIDWIKEHKWPIIIVIVIIIIIIAYFVYKKRNSSSSSKAGSETGGSFSVTRTRTKPDVQ